MEDVLARIKLDDTRIVIRTHHRPSNWMYVLHIDVNRTGIPSVYRLRVSVCFLATSIPHPTPSGSLTHAHDEPRIIWLQIMHRINAVFFGTRLDEWNRLTRSSIPPWQLSLLLGDESVARRQWPIKWSKNHLCMLYSPCFRPCCHPSTQPTHIVPERIVHERLCIWATRLSAMLEFLMKRNKAHPIHPRLHPLCKADACLG